MSNIYTKLKTLMFFSLMLVFMQGFSQTFNKNYADGRVFFKLKNNIPIAITLQNKVDLSRYSLLNKVFSMYSVTDVERLSDNPKEKLLSQTFRVQFSNFAQAEMMIKALEKLDIVEYAEKEPIYYVDWVPDDPYYKDNINGKGNYHWKWYFDLINAEDAWQVSQDQIGEVGSSDIKVAVVDNAVLTTHEDLDVWKQYDAADDDGNASPPIDSWDWSHGTHCSGLATAKTNNGKGLPSLGGNVQLIAVKCTKDNTDNPGSLGYTYDGVKWAMDNGADVISMSFGGSGSSQTFQNLMNTAHDRGIVLLAAAGNDNVSEKHYPAAYNHVICVSSVDSDDGKTNFSNWNDPDINDDWVDIAGPGGFRIGNNTGLLSSVDTSNKEKDYGPEGYYGSMSGTSMSTPVIAGIAGLMLSVYPDLTVEEVEECLISTAVQVADRDSVGPRVDAKAAMDCVVSKMHSAPKTKFSADRTIINIGESVHFTDESAPTANDWDWSFPGGDPNNSDVQNPDVTYNSVGDYDVTLTASNDYGTGNTVTKTAYIHVKDPSEDCDTINHWEGNRAIYTSGNGFVAGTNGYGDLAKAEYYKYEEVDGFSDIKELKLYFVGYGRTTHEGSNSTVTIALWDNNLDLIGSEEVSYDDIMTDVGNDDTTIVTFDPPVTIPGDFFAGFLVPDPSDGDTLVIWTNYIGESPKGGTDVEQLENGNWNWMSDRWTGFDSTSLAMKATVCPGKPYAWFSIVDNHICEGSSVAFTDKSRNTETTEWEWLFEGGDPATSTEQNPLVRYDNAGTYKVRLIAKNSFGKDTLLVENLIEVDPAAYGGIVSSAVEEICEEETVALKVEGSSDDIQWQVSSDNSSWSDISSATLTNYTTPALTSDKYYRVKAESGAVCPEDYSNVVHIIIKAKPIVTANADPGTSLCSGQELTLTGGGADSYTWDHGVADGSAFTPAVGSVKYTVTGTKNGCTNTDEITVVVHNNPTAEAGDNQDINNNQTANLSGSATGGTSPYSYAWSPSAKIDDDFENKDVTTVNLTATTVFTVEVKDKFGCKGTDDVTINVVGGELAINPSTNKTDNTICEGEEITISANASGGTSPYVYTWSPSGSGDSFTVSPISNTTYNVTVKDDSGTEKTASINVVVNPLPEDPTSVSATITNICSGDEVTLSYTGGSGNTFNWYSESCGGTVENSAIVNPTATVTYYGRWENGCGVSSCESVEITVTEATAISVQPQNGGICDGDAYGLSVTAIGDNLSYEWKKDGSDVGADDASYSATSAGSYMCIVTGTCGTVNSETVTVTESTSPTITQNPVDASIEAGQTATFSVTATSDNLSYQWKKDNVDLTETSDVTGTTSNTLSIANASSLDVGNYICKVSNNCGNVISDVAALSVTVNINLVEKYHLQIMPNPSDGLFTVKMQNVATPIHIMIVDITGKIIFNKDYENAESNIIDLSQYAKGIYVMKVILDKEIINSRLILK